MSEPSQQEFVHLIAQHQGLVHKVCMLYARNEDDRKDLFQDIVLQLWKSFPSFKGDAKISTWIYRVALNTAISGLRKSSRKPQHIEIGEQHFNMHESESHLDEQFAVLQKLIQSLPEVERALVMLYLDGNSYEEISSVMGITVNNARVRMNRIREKIKSQVKE